jgi:hypothetical protein
MIRIRYGSACVVLMLVGCGGGSGGMAPTETQNGKFQPPNISLAASAESVASGDRVQLQWSSQRADSCVSSGAWGGIRPLSGEFQTAPITSDQSFTLSCSGPGGSAVARVNVAVQGGDPGKQPDPGQHQPGDGAGPAPSEGEPAVQLKASPAGVERNGSTTLSWDAANVSECSASGDWSGNKAFSGSERIDGITSDRTFRLTCSGSEGSAVALTTVTVREARLSWQAPTHNVDGSPVGKLSGYKIYWGSSPRHYTQSVRINDAGTTSHQLALAPGTHYFAMTALTSDGEESDYSNEISKHVH